MGLFDKPVRGLFLLPKTEPSTIARNQRNAENKGFSAKNERKNSRQHNRKRPCFETGKEREKGRREWWARVVG